MPTPPFVEALRARVGHTMLWLSGSTAVVLRDGPDGEEVLLVRRADSGDWSPVCGIVDPGEEPHLAALREVDEEAGVQAEIDRLVWLSVTDVVTYANGDQTQYIDHTFRCRWVAGEPHPADGEATEARFFSVDALPSMPPEFADRVAVALANRPETRLGRLATIVHADSAAEPDSGSPGRTYRGPDRGGAMTQSGDDVVPLPEAATEEAESAPAQTPSFEPPDTSGGEAVEGRAAAVDAAAQTHASRGRDLVQTADEHGLNEVTMARLDISS